MARWHHWRPSRARFSDLLARAAVPVRAVAWETRYRLQNFSRRVPIPPQTVVAAVGAVAAICLGISQFVDYRGVAVGPGQYEAGYGLVAPPPQTETATAGSAHAYVLLPLALVALALIWLTLDRRWWLGRAIALLGMIGVAVSLLIDMPKGLDEGTAGIAYLGTEVELLEGFWAQLVSSATLAAMGLLLASYVRRATRPGRRVGGRVKDAPEPARPDRGLRHGWRAGADA
jgi:hypothetical protein